MFIFVGAITEKSHESYMRIIASFTLKFTHVVFRHVYLIQFSHVVYFLPVVLVFIFHTVSLFGKFWFCDYPILLGNKCCTTLVRKQKALLKPVLIVKCTLLH